MYIGIIWLPPHVPIKTEGHAKVHPTDPCVLEDGSWKH